MSDDAARTPDEIWSDDLLGRRDEATHLIAYLECVAGRDWRREDKEAYTVAIDAHYGEGKSFFIRRLAETLSLNHPVALVDAWADDLSDEPLTALVATLEVALKPLANIPDISDGVSNFMKKAGRVAKIVSWGLARRGAGLLITGKAVEAAEEALLAVSDDVKDAIKDGITDISKGTLEDASREIGAAISPNLMEKRIANFRETKAAVFDLKESLTRIVDSLADRDLSPPIFIIIDELDRCRPTYAIKLLEEIKHLFDVRGLVFIIAMHSDQLSHSVSGAYGAGFDGRAYLRRFIDRQYHLREPDLLPLLEGLCGRTGLTQEQFNYPRLCSPNQDITSVSLPHLISIYMNFYGLSARDAFTIVDILQTSRAVAFNNRLFLPYLLPLIVGSFRSLADNKLPVPARSRGWTYALPVDHFGREMDFVSLDKIAEDTRNAATMSYNELGNIVNESPKNYAARVVYQNRPWNIEEAPIWSIVNYPKLLRTVSRFTNPQLVQ